MWIPSLVSQVANCALLSESGNADWGHNLSTFGVEGVECRLVVGDSGSPRLHDEFQGFVHARPRPAVDLPRWPVQVAFYFGDVLPAALEPVALAVHLQDMDAVGEPVQQRAGEAFRTEHPGPLIEGQVGGDQDGPALVALAEDLEEEVSPGGGQGDEAQFVDDQQAEAGKLPLQVEQPSLVPGLQRSALPRFHRRRRPSAVLQPGRLPGLTAGI